jgi:deoxyadenosine/deoxycytidine kinase
MTPLESPLYIAVAGNIGVGRQLLTRYLAEDIGAHAQYDLLDSNPFFSKLYDDPKAFAFASQLCFLAQTFVQQCEIYTSVVPVVQARSMAEHFHVFVKSLQMRGMVNKRQFDELDRVYHSFAGVIRPPDLLIVLKAPVGVLLDRIEQRDRPGEKVDRDYLLHLDERYDEWLKKYRQKNLGPIVEIDVASHDMREPDERREAIKLVRAAMAELKR